MTTADEWLARWRDTWHKIAASEFAGETVYSHEAFGVVLAALADAETRAARDAVRLAELERFETTTFSGLTPEDIDQARGRYAWHMFGRLEALADAARDAARLTALAAWDEARAENEAAWDAPHRSTDANVWVRAHDATKRAGEALDALCALLDAQRAATPRPDAGQGEG